MSKLHDCIGAVKGMRARVVKCLNVNPVGQREELVPRLEDKLEQMQVRLGDEGGRRSRWRRGRGRRSGWMDGWMDEEEEGGTVAADGWNGRGR